MHKSRELMILITFFSLWLTNYFGVEGQTILAFFLLFSVGLLHGSNDLQLLSRVFRVKKQRSYYLNLAAYVGVVAVAFVLFYWIPFATLLVFIIVSGYHFGEQHWAPLVAKSKWTNLLYCSYGLFLLSLLFVLNTEDTRMVIEQLAGIQVLDFWFNIAAVVFGLLFLCALFAVRIHGYINNNVLFFELFLLLVFFIVFSVASLVWAFTIYFIFWHSIPSIKEQLLFLYGGVSKKTSWRYLKSAAIIWLFSIGGLFLFDTFIRQEQQLFITIFFSFLGAITFAHTLIISRMFDQQRGEQ